MAENNNSELNVDGENLNSENQNENTNSNNGENENTNSDNQKVPLADLIKERKKRQEFEKKLSEYEEAQRKAKEEKLKEEGKLKELLEEKEAELQKLKSEYEPDALAYRTLISEEKENAKSVLGEQFSDEEIDSMPLQTLRKLVKLTEKKFTPDVDGGGARPPQKVILGDKEKMEAYAMFPGYTKKEAEEAYFETQLKRKKDGKNGKS